MNGPLLRAPVLWLTERAWFRRLATQGLVGRRVAGRFVAGETVEEAIEGARTLGRHDIAAMLDHLGENVTSEAEARAATGQYVDAARRLHEAEDVDGAISVKLVSYAMLGGFIYAYFVLVPSVVPADASSTEATMLTLSQIQRLLLVLATAAAASRQARSTIWNLRSFPGALSSRRPV